MNYTRVRETLRQKFQHTLPGLDAQLTLSPEIRTDMMQDSSIQYQDSAVLLLLFPDVKKKVQIIFIERNVYDGVHSGQIGFPGGKLEKNETFLQAAIRETNEELAVVVWQENIVGALTPLKVPVSKFIIHPYVAMLPKKPVIRADKREVQNVYLSNLREVMHQTPNYGMFTGSAAFKIKAPFLQLAEKRLWGASAMIFAELKAILTTD